MKIINTKGLGGPGKYKVAVASLLVLSMGGTIRAADGNPGSYLTDGNGPDLISVLPPAPKNGDARDRADREIFKDTRKFAGSKRWNMARNDKDTSIDRMLQTFSCATDAQFTQVTAPALAKLMVNASGFTAEMSSTVKKYYRRPRPFLRDSGPVCQAKEELIPTFDYPSGHSTLGWTWAILLAELLPQKSDAILARGAAYGESRVFCGAHNASAVEAGRGVAAISIGVLRNNQQFQDDLKAAKSEIIGLLASAPKPDKAFCDAQRMLILQRPY